VFLGFGGSLRLKALRRASSSSSCYQKKNLLTLGDGGMVEEQLSACSILFEEDPGITTTSRRSCSKRVRF